MMETNEKDILLIEDYLDGKLAADEQAAFERRLETDGQFAALLAMRKELEITYRKAGEYRSVREEIGRVISREKAASRRIKPVWVYSIAASVIIVLGVFIVFQLSNNQLNPFDDRVADSDSAEMLRIDEPESYALRRVAVPIVSPRVGDSFRLVESIPFRWQPGPDTTAELVIMSEPGKMVLIRKWINLSDTLFWLDKDVLPEGKYSWYIGDTLNAGRFVINK